MFYVILVSHGNFASGLHSAAKMIAGDRNNVLSISLKSDMSGDEYTHNFKNLISALTPADKIIILADIIGGSPLTIALKALSDRGLLGSTRAFGGMNLPLALTVILSGENAFSEDPQALLNDAKDSLQEFILDTDQADEDI
ncbi:PTS sugar transporter subunit IIA [Pectinatus haikarae]|uniref:PTS system N-acetylgalactosamine-specific IIA component n=1 Tax=Pectinatus haikarae TaxID=349096 RepID=A0ABT9Y5S8_9FIRM|nr:PTS fructose transporter subunit IIA [Pectinatus haikarae]MDQ0203183.1 PTS system N-acetylgalactosamine-specific IIA component [Pectinatus haikarae]